MTTSELEALGPLVGTTRRYHEILEPRQGDPDPVPLAGNRS